MLGSVAVRSKAKDPEMEISSNSVLVRAKSLNGLSDAFEKNLRQAGILKRAAEQYQFDYGYYYPLNVFDRLLVDSDQRQKLRVFAREAFIPFFAERLLHDPCRWLYRHLPWVSKEKKELISRKALIKRRDIMLFYPIHGASIEICAGQLPYEMVSKELAETAAELGAPNLQRIINYALEKPGPGSPRP